ncbi:hypothetical protein G7085_15955 [Tessaracoccus sp. HDW20]|uniref:hypothetical protein n=1 Tax=Tessaracoccus coleopterorum TaxID=2714950 RepID=UPI0018D3F254|nr:hypothetical protein [Tessaracoccus coleopterorum]NHB85588.1 hypothetical protein [Tessaracoccus coleopterorum]
MHGATVIDPTDLFREPRLDDHAGYTAVASHDQAALSDLCWAVMVGAVPGEVVSKGPLPGVCAHTAERVHCVDVDPYGVTLMLAGAEETLIVFAAFGAGAGEPTVRVARLLEGVAVAAA